MTCRVTATELFLQAGDPLKAKDSEIARPLGGGSQSPYTAPVHPGEDQGQIVPISDGRPSGGEDTNLGDTDYDFDLFTEAENSDTCQDAMATTD